LGRTPRRLHRHSYSSGEGNPPYEAGTADEQTPDLCHRSNAAYGPLLDHALNLGPLIFKACSGAVTNDLLHENAVYPTEPAQLSWLGPQTKTVTLTIGGDDAGFAWVLEHCVAAPPLSPGNLRCSTNKQLAEETQARLNALKGGSYATTPPPLSQPIHSILGVIQAIHSAAHSAHIYVGLYPLLFGERRTKYAKPILDLRKTLACEVGLNLWVSYKDAMWLNRLGKQLNKAIGGPVTKTQRAGIVVTPVTPSGFAGHGFCDERELWFYPITLEVRNIELGGEITPTSGGFHPTEIGQELGYEAAFAAEIK
jgi:hypothetical protein